MCGVGRVGGWCGGGGGFWGGVVGGWLPHGGEIWGLWGWVRFVVSAGGL
ncbi:hypothetical protein [Bartonella raoultii]|nr:hypothetical protein [Bartonella raoultii]